MIRELGDQGPVRVVRRRAYLLAESGFGVPVIGISVIGISVMCNLIIGWLPKSKHYGRSFLP